MLDLLIALFAWLPYPLNILFGGAFVVFIVLALMRFVAWILDMIPFI